MKIQAWRRTRKRLKIRLRTRVRMRTWMRLKIRMRILKRREIRRQTEILENADKRRRDNLLRDNRVFSTKLTNTASSELRNRGGPLFIPPRRSAIGSIIRLPGQTAVVRNPRRNWKLHPRYSTDKIQILAKIEKQLYCLNKNKKAVCPHFWDAFWDTEYRKENLKKMFISCYNNIGCHDNVSCHDNKGCYDNNSPMTTTIAINNSYHGNNGCHDNNSYYDNVDCYYNYNCYEHCYDNCYSSCHENGSCNNNINCQKTAVAMTVSVAMTKSVAKTTTVDMVTIVAMMVATTAVVMIDSAHFAVLRKFPSVEHL
ncbi:unnamed protein product [Nesidiocoris tenuis]|uniref:Uncharacterized protein n=1 Tax=Nesidiocoris tenuis TaxID=355587 RepID=A0A6H5H1A7_9HEMI|nr:unnamed protein product [Nesidiocoris tenuis]